MTVLLIVVLVPIIIFGVTHFVTSSLVRYSTQNRNAKAEYLAQAGIHRAIYNLEAGVTPYTNVGNFGGSDTITVTDVPYTPSCAGIYQMTSQGTSVSSSYPTQVSRTVFAQYNMNTNTVNRYLQGSGTGVPAPSCCDTIWWPFSEGAGNTTGTAPYQGTLTPASPNPQWVAGVIGNALRFNQNNPTNYVLVTDPLPAPSLLDLTTAGTVMAWIRPASIPNQAQQTVVHKGGNTVATNAYALFLFRQSNNNGRVRFWIYNAAGTQYVASGGTNMTLNTWYHIAGVWDSTGLRVYRNGIPDGTTATANRVARTNNNNLYIGASGTLAAAQEFNGRVDEVYVYNCRKTDAEVKAYYNATCAGSGATPCPQP
ncbi:MAG TPA: LamG domain-containing protein [Candidatus Omnitrophota bacterium]|nr:LamG domain-containing protein [Candidatus Omnitrophota bacterium]HRY85730.1 LamG domain-containing protein [Candidatus Omnitrophota bacterium]